MEEQPPVTNISAPTEPATPTPPEPQTSTPPQQPIVAAITSKRKLPKKVLIIVGIVLLLASAAAVYFLVLKKDKQPAATQSTGASQQQSVAVTATGFAPRFSSVQAVVDFENAKWYAATGAVIKTTNSDTTAEYFSNTQGVPVGTPNSLVIHNGQLWVSTLEGVATYNKASNSFIAVKDGISGELQNGELFYDASAKKLYLNSFTGFYSYNDQTKKFESIAGPSNAQTFAADEKYVALYSSANPDWPIWVLNKSTGIWAKNTPAFEQQSYKIGVVSGKVVVFGRTKGYMNCDNAGKITATSAYYLDDKGVWQPFTAFNADKARAEVTLLTNLSTSGVTARTQSCDGNGTEKLYSLSIANNVLTLTNEKPTTNTGTFNNPDEEAALVANLAKATKLHPTTSILDVDGAGNVIFSFSDALDTSSTTPSTGFAVATQNDVTKATVIDTSSIKNTDIVPVLCGTGKDRKLTYLFSGTQHIQVGGGEGFPDGKWSSAKLYSVSDSKIAEYKDLGTDVAAPVFSCTTSDIVWLGTSSLNKMNRDTKAITKVGAAVGSNNLYSSTTAKVTTSGNLWFGLVGTTTKTSTLYNYDTAKGAYTVVASKTDVTEISAASDAYAVVASSVDKNQSSTVFDLTGKSVQTLPANGAPVVNGASSDEFLLLQLSGGDITIFKNFTLSKFKAGVAPAPTTSQNTAYTAWYQSDGSNGFGLALRPSAVYDATHNQFWLNDNIHGVNAIKL